MASPKEIQALIQDSSTFVLDVRTPLEFQSGALPRATLIPVDELDKRIGELPQDKDKTIVVYCAHGRRSLTAAAILKNRGYTSVVNLDGGIVAYGPQSSRG